MRLRRFFHVSLAAAVASCLAPPTSAQQASAPERYRLKAFDSMGWSSRGATIVLSDLPYDKPWDALTPAQQSSVKAWYEAMPSADEPPFPSKGLYVLYEPFGRALSRFKIDGALDAEVIVDANGVASSFSVYKSPHPEITKFIAGVAMSAQYKAAVCAGQPCAGTFPVRLSFSAR